MWMCAEGNSAVIGANGAKRPIPIISRLGGRLGRRKGRRRRLRPPLCLGEFVSQYRPPNCFSLLSPHSEKSALLYDGLEHPCAALRLGAGRGSSAGNLGL